MGLEQAERTGIDLGKQPQLRQITAHQGEVVFVVQVSQALDPFNRAFVAHLATHSVGRVGGINHHPTFLDNVDGLFNQTRLWVFRMNLEKLTHSVYLFRRWQWAGHI